MCLFTALLDTPFAFNNIFWWITRHGRQKRGRGLGTSWYFIIACHI